MQIETIRECQRNSIKSFYNNWAKWHQTHFMIDTTRILDEHISDEQTYDFKDGYDYKIIFSGGSILAIYALKCTTTSNETQIEDVIFNPYTNWLPIIKFIRDTYVDTALTCFSCPFMRHHTILKDYITVELRGSIVDYKPKNATKNHIETYFAFVPKLFLDYSQVFYVGMTLALVWNIENDKREIYHHCDVSMVKSQFAVADCEYCMYDVRILIFEKPFVFSFDNNTDISLEIRIDGREYKNDINLEQFPFIYESHEIINDLKSQNIWVVYGIIVGDYSCVTNHNDEHVCQAFKPCGVCDGYIPLGEAILLYSNYISQNFEMYTVHKNYSNLSDMYVEKVLKFA